MRIPGLRAPLNSGHFRAGLDLLVGRKAGHRRSRPLGEPEAPNHELPTFPEPRRSLSHPLGEELEALNDEISISLGTRKSLSYFAEYDRILAPRRHEQLRLLELGVFDATSILIWQRYLPNAIIVGLDSGPMHPRFPVEDRIKFIQGLQDDPAVLDRAVAAAGGPFDLIIDDCSHIARHTKKSFTHLFPRHLLPGGSYVIEDIGTSFLTGVFDDGRDFVEPPMVDADPDITEFPSHQNGIVGFVKQLLDFSQMDVATRAPKSWPIERVTTISNMAIVEKSR